LPLDFADLVVIDDIVPSDFSPFRTIEYEHYLRFFNAAVLSLEGWHTWIGNESFEELLGRLPIDLALKPRIVPFRTHANITARLAYVTFLGNAIRLVPYFENRQIPFILQLYPGGGFEIDRPDTDEKLRRVLLSELCRKVIVTQRITERYIVDKIGCDPAKVEHIFGGVFESRLPFSFDRDKRFYPRDKDTIDLCFVAHKYAGNITAKGYDQFVAICLELAGGLPQLRCHVVGDYTQADVPLGAHHDRFTFYGRRSSEFLADFFRSMDAIISINRPFDLTPGSFDGFPTGACIEAGFRGVLNCLNDPLDLNPCLTDGQDILLLNPDHRSSAARLGALLADPSELYRLAEQGLRKYHEVFDTDRQLWARSRVIAAELTRHEGLIVRPAPEPSALDGESFERVTLPYRRRLLELQATMPARPVPGVEPPAPPDPPPADPPAVAYDGGARTEVEALQAALAALSKQLDAIRSSTSWRLTGPMRHLLAGHPRVARLGRRGLKLAWWTAAWQLPARYRTWSMQRAAAAQPQLALTAPATPELWQAPAEMSTPTPELSPAPRPVFLQAEAQHERILELERALRGYETRLAGLESHAGALLNEIRREQDRTDFALGAIEGILEEIARFETARASAEYQSVFDYPEPLVSICVATADRAELLLERCIPSLLAQTYRNLQIVVVGDHCTDDTEQRLAQLGDARISFRNLPDRGPYPPSGRARWCVAGSNAMNAALARCEGQFVTHLDDDDSYKADRIERLVQASLERRPDFCWHPFWAEGDDGAWRVIGDTRFALGQVTTGSIFYHRYFARFKWDPQAYRLDEPGDWNRLRKIKLLRPSMHFLAEPLLRHYREHHGMMATSQRERSFADRE
jgi:hypothetical protein